MKRSIVLLPLFLSLFLSAAAHAQQRTLRPADFASIRDVSTPQLSSDGKWVVYSVRQPDLRADKNRRHLWLASVDGKESAQITFSDDSESTPRWSPDGKRIAFLSSRGADEEHTQLWVMNRIGGEAQKVTTAEADVQDFEWSPDSTRLVLVVDDPEPQEPPKPDPDNDEKEAKDEKSKSDKKKTDPPIVINRFLFKKDIQGYLTAKRQHLYLLSLDGAADGTRKLEPLTRGNYNEYQPAWSPDGSRIAFVTKRSDDAAYDPDRDDNWDIYVIEPKSGATPKRLTSYVGADNLPGLDSPLAWSPDSKWIAYVRGGDPKLIYYAVRHLGIVSTSGEEKVLTPSLDRDIESPTWSADGRSIYATIEDDRNVTLVRVPATGGAHSVVAGGKRVISAYDVSGDRIALLAGDPRQPAEIFILENGSERRLTHHNDAFLAGIKLGAVEEIAFPSKDGTDVHGFLVTPPDSTAGKRIPTILRIHGGPVSQFANQFSFEWQLLAANGYAVVAVNPRGSSGRGEKYSSAIWADWGNRDAQDVLAGVDYAIKRGIADPARLGVGGWSYGGILTNYVIAQDKRFKAATSGASIANILAGYGTDEYTLEYEYELGPPWKNPETWMKISFPFLHADRIVTPTLFLAGEKDFNVPLLNSEQMYQALRSLGVPTELVIYPGQYHGISKPTYVRDRYERYLAWYAKYVK